MVGREVKVFPKKRKKPDSRKQFFFSFHSFLSGLDKFYTPTFPAVLSYNWKKKEKTRIYNRAE